ncbi:DUF6766 family protein [Streptomyces sp. NPDC004270]
MHVRQLQAPVSWPQYLGSADFWNRTLQNWQSELLAVASMAILPVYLRQLRQLEDMTHTLCVITAPAGWTGRSQRPVGGSAILRRSGRLSSAEIRAVRRPRR